MSFILRRAARERLRIAIFQMLRQLFDDFGLTRRREIQGRQPLSDFLFPFGHTRFLLTLSARSEALNLAALSVLSDTDDSGVEQRISPCRVIRPCGYHFRIAREGGDNQVGN